MQDPASIISVGNVTARGGIVDFSTNGNIFTGNVDVSPDNPFPVYGYGNQRITLKGFNIFTGNLNAGADVAPGSIVYKVVPDYDSRCYLSDLSDFLDSYFICGVAAPETIRVPSGSISLDATQYLRTGDISTRSRTAQGGNVTIGAGDAIVGAIDTSGVYKGGDVSIKTDVPFEPVAITTDGAQKGTVSIGTLEVSPDVSNGINSDILDISPVDIEDFEEVQANILQFMTARLLAGQKMTSQEIAAKLDISLELAQIAVLNPIGENIQVNIPDFPELSRDGILVAGKIDKFLDFLKGLVPIVKGGSKNLKKWIIKSPQKVNNPKIPGRVRSRINIRNGQGNSVGSGLNYALKRHGGSGPPSKSQFNISIDQIKIILQRKDVIHSPVRISGTSGNYIREVNLGRNIGNLPLNKGGQPTSVITIITDKYGNLVNTFPGTLGRGASLP